MKENSINNPVLGSTNATDISPGGVYQPHIDGLRALAVLSVVIYHYSDSYLRGGFVGVDIFFVISGYLITGILIKAYTQNSFGSALLDFYQRRIRRIFPAMALVLTFLLACGWLLLFPIEYSPIGGHISASAGFVENILLWSESGYFDKQAITKPLLHFWSLAVEEQFYIFWPLVLFLLTRLRWRVTHSIAVIAGLSFLVNIYLVLDGKATSAFYLPHARAWELMAGAWLAANPASSTQQQTTNRGLHEACAWAGLGLIAFALIYVKPSFRFPGFWAILPIFGAALLIRAGRNTWLNRRIFSQKLAVGIGLISYPLYLWHWTLLSLTIVVFGKTDVSTLRERKAIALAASLLLAWLTYRFIEKKVRHRKGYATLTLVVTVAALGLAGFAVNRGQGARLPRVGSPLSEVRGYLESLTHPTIAENCYLKNDHTPSEHEWYCTFGDRTAKRSLVFTGDSHSESMIRELDAYGKSRGIKIIYAGGDACLSLLKIRSPQLWCHEIAIRLAHLSSQLHPDAIIFIERWSAYAGTGATFSGPPSKISLADANGSPIPDNNKPMADIFAIGLDTTLEYYQRLRIPVILFRDNPQQLVDTSMMMHVLRFNPYDAENAINANAVTLFEHIRDQGRTNFILDETARRYSNVHVVDIDSALCGTRVCPLIQDGKFLYYDDDHLSTFGASLAGPILAHRLDFILDVQDVSPSK